MPKVNNNNIKCPFCGKIYQCHEDFRQHLIQNHGDELKNIQLSKNKLNKIIRDAMVEEMLEGDKDAR